MFERIIPVLCAGLIAIGTFSPTGAQDYIAHHDRYPPYTPKPYVPPTTTSYKATTTATTTSKPVTKKPTSAPTTTKKATPAPTTTKYKTPTPTYQPPYTDKPVYKDGYKYTYGDKYKRKHVLASTRYIDMISYMLTYAKYMALLASEYKYNSKAVATMTDCGPASGFVTFQYDKVGKCLKITGKFVGLEYGRYAFAIHQYGDTRDTCSKVGHVFTPYYYVPKDKSDVKTSYGFVQYFDVGKDGCGTISTCDCALELQGPSGIMGRSVVAHKIYKRIHDIDLISLSPETIGQINVFLNRLSGEPIGFTVLRIFVIDRNTILTILGLLMTYFLLIIQMMPPSSNNSQKSSRNISNTTSFLINENFSLAPQQKF